MLCVKERKQIMILDTKMIEDRQQISPLNLGRSAAFVLFNAIICMSHKSNINCRKDIETYVKKCYNTK